MILSKHKQYIFLEIKNVDFFSPIEYSYYQFNVRNSQMRFDNTRNFQTKWPLKKLYFF